MHADATIATLATKIPTTASGTDPSNVLSDSVQDELSIINNTLNKPPDTHIDVKPTAESLSIANAKPHKAFADSGAAASSSSAVAGDPTIEEAVDIVTYDGDIWALLNMKECVQALQAEVS